MRTAVSSDKYGNSVPRKIRTLRRSALRRDRSSRPRCAGQNSSPDRLCSMKTRGELFAHPRFTQRVRKSPRTLWGYAGFCADRISRNERRLCFCIKDFAERFFGKRSGRRKGQKKYESRFFEPSPCRDEATPVRLVRSKNAFPCQNTDSVLRFC